jgi:hypothetical protein
MTDWKPVSNYFVQAEAAARWFEEQWLKHESDCSCRLGGVMYDSCDCGYGLDAALKALAAERETFVTQGGREESIDDH